MDNTRDVQIVEKLKHMLGIPKQAPPLDPEYRGHYKTDQIKVEKWIWTSERGSRVTSTFYLPLKQTEKLPGIVITNGHGGSKNSSYAQYTGQLYAKLGIACLLYDTIGEEERHIRGEMGSRAHDHENVIRRADQAGRLIMGKMVFDSMRAIDFISSRPEVDADNLGIAGNSLGGSVATWLVALEPRIQVAIISGSGFTALNGQVCKPCCAIPSDRMLDICDYSQLVSLAAPHCAILSMNGDHDEIVTQGREDYWDQHLAHAHQISNVYKYHGVDHKFKVWFQQGSGHRAYHLHIDAIEWLGQHFGLKEWTPQKIKKLPTISLEAWFSKHGLQWPERGRDLYWVPRHHRGAIYADMDIHPIPTEHLLCLSSDEIGRDEYTLEGWLKQIES